MLSFCRHAKRSLVKIVGAALGAYETNCYMLDFDNQVLVVDPGAESKVIIDNLKKEHKDKKVNIYLTHGHYDHTGAVPDLCDEYPDAKIYASENDADFYVKPELNLSTNLGANFTLKKYLDRFVYVKDGEVLNLGNEKFNVMDLPGHTPGSTGLRHDSQKLLFSGDTLFQGSIGNTELPKGNFDLIINSIMKKLYPLEDNYRVFPGHGDPTTLGDEKKNNPFILAEIGQK